MPAKFLKMIFLKQRNWPPHARCIRNSTFWCLVCGLFFFLSYVSANKFPVKYQNQWRFSHRESDGNMHVEDRPLQAKSNNEDAVSDGDYDYNDVDLDDSLFESQLQRRPPREWLQPKPSNLGRPQPENRQPNQHNPNFHQRNNLQPGPNQQNVFDIWPAPETGQKMPTIPPQRGTYQGHPFQTKQPIQPIQPIQPMQPIQPFNPSEQPSDTGTKFAAPNMPVTKKFFALTALTTNPSSTVTTTTKRLLPETSTVLISKLTHPPTIKTSQLPTTTKTSTSTTTKATTTTTTTTITTSSTPPSTISATFSSSTTRTPPEIQRQTYVFIAFYYLINEKAIVNAPNVLLEDHVWVRLDLLLDLCWAQEIDSLGDSKADLVLLSKWTIPSKNMTTSQIEELDKTNLHLNASVVEIAKKRCSSIEFDQLKKYLIKYAYDYGQLIKIPSSFTPYTDDFVNEGPFLMATFETLDQMKVFGLETFGIYPKTWLCISIFIWDMYAGFGRSNDPTSIADLKVENSSAYQSANCFLLSSGVRFFAHRQDSDRMKDTSIIMHMLLKKGGRGNIDRTSKPDRYDPNEMFYPFRVYDQKQVSQPETYYYEFHFMDLMRQLKVPELNILEKEGARLRYVWVSPEFLSE